MKQKALLSLKVSGTDAPLVARGRLILPYEMAKALRLPEVMDRHLPPPGSPRWYRPSEFVMPLILMFHGGEKKLEDLRELRAEAPLGELLELKKIPASCTVGDWLRRMGEDHRGLKGLEAVNLHLLREVLRRDHRERYTLDVDATVMESEKRHA